MNIHTSFNKFIFFFKLYFPKRHLHIMYFIFEPTWHLSPPPRLSMSSCFRCKLYPGLKRSGALISRADRRGGVNITTVDCGDLTSREDCHSGVDIATVDFWTGGFSGNSVYGVWIGTQSAVSGYGSNLDSICSGPELFTGLGDVGSEEQRRTFIT